MIRAGALFSCSAAVAALVSIGPRVHGQDPAGRGGESVVDPLAEVPIPADPGAGAEYPLTLMDALRLALRHNTTIKVEELLPHQASEDVRAARAIFEPEFFSHVSVSRSKDPTRNVFQPAISRETYDARFGVRQLVPSGGLFDLAFSPTRLTQNSSVQGFPARQYTTDFTATYTQPLLRGAWDDYTMRDVHVQESRRAAAAFRYDRVVQDTLLAVVQAYWDLVFARENYRVAFQAFELARRQLDRTDQRIRVGDLAPLDRVTDEAEVARRREELVTAENEIRDREDDLRRLLFDDADGELWRRQIEPLTPIGAVDGSGLLDWRIIAARARRERPDLRALRADVSAAEVQLEAAERDVLPQLDLVGSYTTNSVREGFDDAWSDTTDFQFPDWSLRLELSVPIGNNAARAARDRAGLEVERTRRALYAAMFDVDLEVRDAVRRLATLAESIERGRESVRLAETNLTREVARKDAGESTTLDVQQRNQELQEARSRLLRNLLDYRIAESTLEHVQGTLAGEAEDETTAEDGAAGSESTGGDTEPGRE